MTRRHYYDRQIYEKYRCLDWFLGHGDPYWHELLESIRRHSRVRNSYNLKNGGFAAGKRALQVSLEQRGKRLFVLPLRMLRGECFHAVEREGELNINRLLSP